MKPDKIKIEDLEVFANHGVFPEKMYWGRNLWCLRLCIRIPDGQD